MQKYLKNNIYTKHILKFNKNNKFKILMFSDIQETLQYDNRTLLSMECMIESEKPDLVFLGGDNCDGTILKTSTELKNYLDIFTSPMEKRKIPWAHVFGNHDHDMECTDFEMQQIYESYPYCVSKHTNSNIYGTTNFVLPIKDSKEEKIVFNIWGLDSNNIKEDFLNPEILPDKTIMPDSWDIIHFDQLMWYWNSSVELEVYNKSKIPGMMIMHIPPWEFRTAVNNPKETNLNGSMIEKMDIGALNSGVFSTILQRNDIKCIACGHAHKNNFEADYCGIKMCLVGCTGFSPYGMDSIRGGRVFEIDENDTKNIYTYTIHAKDYL